jgi:antirestriction protein ArdC
VPSDREPGFNALNNDPRAIFIAASKAQQAADWMHAQHPKEVTVPS